MDPILMRVAANLADSSSSLGIGGPFGAIIIDKEGNPLGLGVNRVLADNDPTAHAEMVAIRKACASRASYDLSDCVIYATGFPCPMCLSAIMWAGIKTVYFGTSMDDAKSLGFQDEDMYLKFKSDQFGVQFEQIERETCIKLFENYKAKQGTIY